jgi:tRNA (cmo5U34)-methyltransferase
MTDAARTFDAQSERYDGARRRLIPPFEAFYGTAVQSLGLAGAPLTRILDLGAGTGLLARAVRLAHPGAELTLIDAAPSMLERARESLGAERVRYEQVDFARRIPDGPWDAVVSALAIHHLTDGEKRELFARVCRALRPGGVFVNAEQVAGPTPLFDAFYARWHEQKARSAGSSDAEWEAALERMAHDRCAPVEAQLAWLREAGFADADCLFKDHRFAVLIGRRDADAPPAA